MSKTAQRLAIAARPRTGPVDLMAVPLDVDMAKRVFDTTGLDERDRALLERRRVIWEAGFDGGFVAVDRYGTPAYLQWFLGHQDRDRIRAHWGPLFPPLPADTLLVEGHGSRLGTVVKGSWATHSHW